MIRYSSNGFYDDDRLIRGIIDLTQLSPNEEEDEEEISYCVYCDRKMLHCKHDNNDMSNGPLCKKGQYICPRCGRVEDSDDSSSSSPQNRTKGKKEKKGPRLTHQTQKPFIGIFSMPGNPFQTRADYDDIDTFGDEYLEAHGADIKETQTYFSESGRTIVRKK